MNLLNRKVLPVTYYAVAIVRENTVVGHLPQNICLVFWTFLSLPRTSIRTEVRGARVNRGGGHGLEVPVRYYFQGPDKAINWAKKRVGEAVKAVEDKLKRCMKNAV